MHSRFGELVRCVVERAKERERERERSIPIRHRLTLISFSCFHTSHVFLLLLSITFFSIKLAFVALIVVNATWKGADRFTAPIVRTSAEGLAYCTVEVVPRFDPLAPHADPFTRTSASPEQRRASRARAKINTNSLVLVA